MSSFAVLDSFWQLTQQYQTVLDVGLLLFARVFGFVLQAPILNRKDVPTQLKTPFVFLLTLCLINNPEVQASVPMVATLSLPLFLVYVALNALFGTFVGFAIRLIHEVISSAGGLTNSQIGFSMANMMDPTTRQQNALLGPLFGFIGTVLFLQIGGMEWLLKGLTKSLSLMPLHLVHTSWFKVITFDVFLQQTEQTLSTALLLAAPFFVVTIITDIMFGIVNKTAQQIPVFQISSSLKPLFGLTLLILCLPGVVSTMRYVFLNLGVKL
ncbi:MAG: flagellar biosynthetic protein FliR [Vampirovibrionales bacterium]